MGLLVKNKNDYDQGGLLGEYFDMPSLDVQNINYDDIKKKISKLDIDLEEKNDIITKINNLAFINNPTKKKKVENEINDFLKKNNL